MSCLGDASIGIWSFIPSPHPTDECGTNGLPLTPNSIVVMGRFEFLKTFYHENVCQYLEIVRAKHERLIVAEEYHENNLYKLMQEGKSFSNDELTSIMFDVIKGLVFLNNHGIISRNVSPNNILLNSKGTAKHTKFGLYHMTANGSLVAFPIGSPKYTAPEVLAAGPGLSLLYGPSSFKADVWSVGMVLLNLVIGGSLWLDIDECNEVQKIFENIFGLVKRQKETFENCLNILINDHKAPEKLQNLKPEIISFLKACLTIKPAERPSALELLDHELFQCFDKNKTLLENGVQSFPSIHRSDGIEISDLRNEANKRSDEKDEDHLACRYRLVRSFFTKESKARNSCITCRDILSWICCCTFPEEAVSKRPLTLADLLDTQPEYTCNLAVNGWRKTDAEGETDFEVLTLSPKQIERVDRQCEEKEFGMDGFVKPRDLKLSTAMATSAAVLSYELGGVQGANKPFREMRILLGLGLGTDIVTQPELTMNWCSKVLPLIVQLCLGISTTIVPILRYFEEDLERRLVLESFGTLVFAGLVLVLILIAVIPTGAENPGWIERFARWCIINIYHVRLIRQLIGVTNTGPTPPPVMSLSDGGHVENLGLLALLKLRLPRIVVVNGGALDSGDNYASDLLRTLEQARKKLQCSFTGVSGRDILEDVRAEFLDRPPGERPRSYRFKVAYYEQFGPNVGKKTGEGEILMLMPRHPDDGLRQFEDSKWCDFDGDVQLDLDEAVWGPGPALKADEVNRLSGCCFDCCHVKLPFSTLSGFPFHSTANQFFTSKQFSAYHREGYRACAEAEAAEFLINDTKKTNVVTTKPQSPEMNTNSTVIEVETCF